MDWTQTRYGVYLKSVTEIEKKPLAAQLWSKGKVNKYKIKLITTISLSKTLDVYRKKT